MASFVLLRLLVEWPNKQRVVGRRLLKGLAKQTNNKDDHDQNLRPSTLLCAREIRVVLPYTLAYLTSKDECLRFTLVLLFDSSRTSQSRKDDFRAASTNQNPGSHSSVLQ